MNNPASVGGPEGVRCPVAGHENEKITSFCLTNNCWTPLCKECVQMHREYHEEANETVDLKPFLLAREETEKGIQKNLSQADERVNEIQKIILGDINQINQDLESLSKSRTLLISLVNDYFNAIENEYKQHVVDKYRKKESLAQKTMGELSLIKNKLNEHIKQIRVPNLCLGVIENAHLSNYTLDIEKTFKSFLDVELEEKKCQVRVCSEMIPNLKNKMKEYIKIEQNPSIYLSFGNSIRSPEDQQAFIKNQITFNSPFPEPESGLKNDSPSIKLAEAATATGTGTETETGIGTGTGTGSPKLLAKSTGPEELEKSTYSAEWDKTLNSRESQERSVHNSRKSKRSTRKPPQDQEELKEEEAEEVLTEHTVYSSDTETRIQGLDENQSNAESSVISELSENTGFEEINMSPTMDGVA